MSAPGPRAGSWVALPPEVYCLSDRDRESVVGLRILAMRIGRTCQWSLPIALKIALSLSMCTFYIFGSSHRHSIFFWRPTWGLVELPWIHDSPETHNQNLLVLGRTVMSLDRRAHFNSQYLMYGVIKNPYLKKKLRNRLGVCDHTSIPLSKKSSLKGRSVKFYRCAAR